ncbi:hypothetical protein [Nonomuraea sp. NEAU-A123]|uniref:hypothetical protein n=1 Tax=Nonomuraea sp. NEAU-A123 TaxID=2839649 RepID=UPI001BE417FB|nr:hypothetical protein [Nonomuraea sp. NEAU-A123]MBT2235448.1 hypothetical protein [Nonomuraea sp. NEAU-A123]
MDSDLATRILYRVGFVLRLVLLLPLLAGLVILSAGISPSSRTLEQFRRAVLAGDVDQVTYRASGSGELVSLTWSESLLVWHEVGGAIADAKGAYTTARLTADARRAFNRPSLTQKASKSDGNGILPDWPFDVRGGWWIAASWVIVFLAMLFSPPRLANRWAWFWLFTVGQVGAILYLVLEPRPLWQGPGEGLTRDKRVDGGSGCRYSIILAIVSGLAALGIGRLIELVLG